MGAMNTRFFGVILPIWPGSRSSTGGFFLRTPVRSPCCRLWHRSSNDTFAGGARQHWVPVSRSPPGDRSPGACMDLYECIECRPQAH
jgi:hypothetical protein